MADEAPLTVNSELSVVTPPKPGRPRTRKPGYRERLQASYKNPVESRLPTIRYLGTITLDHTPDGAQGFVDKSEIYMPVGSCQRCGMLIRWEVEVREKHRRRCK